MPGRRALLRTIPAVGGLALLGGPLAGRAAGRTAGRTAGPPIVKPLIDAAAWRLRVHGSGVRRPQELSYGQLRSMPSVALDAAIECAGNGRSFFATQRGQEASGTPWRLGGIGVARWRGVPLPPDHGFPVRVVVPSWIGIASIKWVGDLQVSAEPLSSPWDTRFYRFFGPGYPEGGSPPLAEQVTKSAFELPWGAAVPSGSPYPLRGRSWSGCGRIVRVEVSTDGGARWRPARLPDGGRGSAWTRWRATWPDPLPGERRLLARATDETGAVQPATTRFNELGYLFDAIVAHPVQVS